MIKKLLLMVLMSCFSQVVLAQPEAPSGLLLTGFRHVFWFLPIVILAFLLGQMYFKKHDDEHSKRDL